VFLVDPAGKPTRRIDSVSQYTFRLENTTGKDISGLEITFEFASTYVTGVAKPTDRTNKRPELLDSRLPAKPYKQVFTWRISNLIRRAHSEFVFKVVEPQECPCNVEANFGLRNIDLDKLQRLKIPLCRIALIPLLMALIPLLFFVVFGHIATTRLAELHHIVQSWNQNRLRYICEQGFPLAARERDQWSGSGLDDSLAQLGRIKQLLSSRGLSCSSDSVITSSLEFVQEDVQGSEKQVQPVEKDGVWILTAVMSWELDLVNSRGKRALSIYDKVEYTAQKVNGRWRIVSEQSSLDNVIEQNLQLPY
jgi:hypothetical protein